MRRRAFPVGLSVDERTTLRERARLHRVSVASYIRSTALGYRPGTLPGMPAAEADAWWDGLSADRRASVHGWLTAAASRPDGPDTMPLFAMED